MSNNTIRCPICGGDRSQKSSIALDALIKQSNIIREYVNPGGRELVFEKKGRIQLSDECNACDHLKLTKFLKESVSERSE